MESRGLVRSRGMREMGMVGRDLVLTSDRIWRL
jgi:hypothetical protein